MMSDVRICNPEFEAEHSQLAKPVVEACCGGKSSRTMLGKLRVMIAAFLASLFSAHASAELSDGLAAYNKADYAAAMRELRPLAERGNGRAQNTLGRMYSQGHGVAIDQTEAVKWFSKAAEQGDAEARSSLGFFYLMGRGVKQDSDLALNWTRKAADQGEMTAQYNLGSMYGNGYGVKQDYAEAAPWYRKAAEKGLADAQYNLGVLYRQGLGVPKDLVLAYMLFSLSAATGHRIAIDSQEAIRTQMTQKQIQEGKGMCARWERGRSFPIKSKTGSQKL